MADASLTNHAKKPKGYYDSRRHEMLGYIPEDVRTTLEFGSALGRFAALIKERFGAETWGVEIEEKVAEESAKNLDRVINADANEALKEIPDNYFDCIIFNDILEHLVDPYSLLVSVKKKLTDNGVLVASIPNVRYCCNYVDFVLMGRWDYQDGGTLDKTHLRFFTSKSILKMFDRLGFEVIRMEGIRPTKNKLFRLLNTLLFKALDDLKYFQFATVARPRSNEG